MNFTRKCLQVIRYLITYSRRKKRDVSHQITERMSVLKTVEQYLPRLIPLPFNTTGHDCVLRAICEVARTPRNDDGMFGDFLNMLLTPQWILDSLPGSHRESEYLQAQSLGHHQRDCSSYAKECPLSMFEVSK